jgi:hypothetical protein
MTDKAAKKGIAFSPEQLAKKREESKLVADSWHPGMEKFKKIPGVINYNHTEHQIEPLIKKLQGLLKKADLTSTAPTMTSTAPTMTGGGDLLTRHSTVNIPNQTLAQKDNRPSFGQVWRETVGPEHAMDLGMTGLERIAPALKASAIPAARTLGKSVPFVGNAATSYDVAKRLRDQDYVGAGIDALSGAAANYPGPGTVVSLIGTGVNLGRDLDATMSKYPGAPHMPQDNSPAIKTSIRPPVTPSIQNIQPSLAKAGAAAWQRSEGKNPEGGLNAKGRASYKRETGGTLKAPVTEKDPSGERAKRQNSFCSRMCGMKRENTGSEGQSDPDSRINKSLRKWNCKCGEDHGSLYEKVACVVKTAAADHPLTSSNIKAVGYDKKDRTLEIAFHSGGEYKYKGVPKSIFHRLKKVKSPGKFFHKHIKKDEKFPYEKQGE